MIVTNRLECENLAPPHKNYYYYNNNNIIVECDSTCRYQLAFIM